MGDGGDGGDGGWGRGIKSGRVIHKDSTRSTLHDAKSLQNVCAPVCVRVHVTGVVSVLLVLVIDAAISNKGF